MAKITINGISFDPAAQGPALASSGLEKKDSAHTDYILVQAAGPLNAAQRKALETVGAQLIEYVPADTYIARFKPADLSPVRALPFVKWAHAYLEGFKISPALLTPEASERGADLLEAKSVETSMAQEPRIVEIVLHRDIDPAGVKAEIAKAARLDVEDIRITRGKVRLAVQPQMLERIARMDAVRHIEELTPTKLHNRVAINLIGADAVHTHANLQGRGQVVAVCDTGFDLGSKVDVHPAFKDRVRQVYPLGRPTGTDPHGHGTHVAGSVLGDGASAAMGGSIRGAAPKAELVLQSVLDSFGGLGGLPDNLNDLFTVPYEEHEARVHTNSWGSAAAGAYTANSFEVDEFVWNHRDMVVLFSAGNEGVDSNGNGVVDNGSIGSPATAKNCITVGASESQRPAISKSYGSAWPSDFPVDPLAADKWADNPSGIAAFSSRGPTRDGRIKPDLVAPGTAILSTHSRKASVGSFWGASSDPLYCFMGGTSMATPIVAGCAAVVREFLGTKGNAKPSAALVKATLINGARDIPGQYTPSDAGPTPNFAEGFGRVDMPATVGELPDGTTVVWRDEDRALDTGEEWRHDFVLAANSDLKVTLVWTDPPGEALQNDLDLIVQASDGSERHGNVAAGSSDFDRRNNVEQVHWLEAPAGDVTILVRAHRIALNPQSFAIVIRVSA